ncbi:MAG: hypothetical protein KAU38_05165 [Desulfobacterales bacterium]|nr:hypothetical protein [Desulfobacterales bacterium]
MPRQSGLKAPPTPAIGCVIFQSSGPDRDIERLRAIFSCRAMADRLT